MKWGEGSVSLPPALPRRSAYVRGLRHCVIWLPLLPLTSETLGSRRLLGVGLGKGGQLLPSCPLCLGLGRRGLELFYSHQFVLLR